MPFDFDESKHDVEWVHSLTTQILTLSYLSTTLTHEARYCLDLSKQSDHVIAYKLLERVLESKRSTEVEDVVPVDPMSKPGGCNLLNTTLDGAPLKLSKWRVGRQVGDAWVVPTTGLAAHVRGQWRVPKRGVFCCDFIAADPVHLTTQHHRFDLSR